MGNSEPRRRVSYTLPPPASHDLFPLILPPAGSSKLGQSAPLLSYARAKPSISNSASNPTPRHRLGVTSLALDTTTILQDSSSPNGILYSGGRDGMVVSWDLDLHMREKVEELGEESNIRRPKENWELITGWANDSEDSDDEDVASGDILGEVTKNRSRSGNEFGRTERRTWHLDTEDDNASTSPSTTRFRQGAQAHMEWINDIKLCNQNQTVISASSDGTIKAWSPHHASAAGPSQIGQHQDYVRCLGVCLSQNWVASGSFDKSIKLWDVSRLGGTPATPQEPLATLASPDSDASIYALAVDQCGSIVASGGPDRIVRIWDPRAGISGRGGRNGKLVGHTDNIRSILISQDSKYILTASSDASIKLWSLATQRCLHTFTHHTESVWSLWSDDPGLGIFYSGDKSGLVCRVDVKSEIYNVGDGECVVLCREDVELADSSQGYAAGISSMVALDNNVLWTASGDHPNIKKWQIPLTKRERTAHSRTLRRDGTLMANDNETWSTMKRTETPSIISTSSATHVPDRIEQASGAGGYFSTSPKATDQDDNFFGIPYDSMIRLGESIIVYGGASGGRPSGFMRSSIRSLSSLTGGISSRQGTTTYVSGSSTAITNMASPTAAKPSSPAQLTGHAAYQHRDIATLASPYCSSGPLEIIPGDVGLVRASLLNDRVHAVGVDSLGNVGVWNILRGTWKGAYRASDVRSLIQCGAYSPREALESVRNRIEGEAVVPSWCSVDTKSGVLNVHISERGCFDAEVYADELGFKQEKGFTDETKLNLGKVVLKNLFSGFIKEEVRLYTLRQRRQGKEKGISRDAPQRPDSKRPNTCSSVFTAQNFKPAIPISPSVGVSRVSPLITPMIPLHVLKDGASPLTSIPQSPAGIEESPTLGDDTLPSSIKPIKRLRSGTVDSQLQSSEGEETPVNKDSLVTPTGLMGRLKNLGKKPSITASSINKASEPPVAPISLSTAERGTSIEIPPEEPVQKTIVQSLLSQSPPSPPPSLEAPYMGLSSRITVMISEESESGYHTIYRGPVSSLHQQEDVTALEESMPQWLLEYTLLNNIPNGVAAAPKLSFVMCPYILKEGEEGEQLPEFLNTAQSKLTASRDVRVRKLAFHVHEKLEKITSSPPSSPSYDPFQSNEKDTGRSRAKPEDIYEILCNDIVLPVNMTLTQVRHYIWKQSTELVLFYRKKVPSRLGI